MPALLTKTATPPYAATTWADADGRAGNATKAVDLL
jgi:hypothetical protein